MPPKFNSAFLATIKITFIHTILIHSEKEKKKTPDLKEQSLRYLKTVKFFKAS